MNAYHPHPNDLKKAILRAQKYIGENPLFLDTETTGLGDQDEICEIAIVDLAGQVLLNSLVKTINPIPLSATAIHGITNEMISETPTFSELLPRLDDLLKDQRVLVYNAQFDEQMIANTARLGGFAVNGEDAFKGWWWAYEIEPGKYKSNWACAMKLYARFYGEWNDYHGSYRWQPLWRAASQCNIQLPHQIHRAHADAEMTRQLVLYMAGQMVETQPKLFKQENQDE